MIKTKVSIEIQRPVAEVFAFVSQIENFPHWFGDLIQESRQTSPGPVGLGSTFSQTHLFLGRRFATTFTITSYDPDHEFCVASSAGPVPFQGCFLFEPVPGGTRCTDQHEINPGGFFGLFGSLLVGRLHQQADANLITLKRLLEARPAPPPAP